MTRVAVLDDYQAVAERYGLWETLPPGTEVAYFFDHAHTADQLVARLRHFDVVVVMRERSAFPREVLERLPELKLLVTSGYRNAVIDVEAAAELGIVVSGTGGHLAGTPELTWGLILSVVRHIPTEVASLRAGGWQQTLGGDLAGKTLGVLGLGNMGTYVARIGQAFGMNVIAWSENLTEQKCLDHGVTLTTRDALFANSDVLTVHLQLSPRTVAMVGAKELAMMKPTSVLINTSRGPIVVEEALIDALNSKQIAGVGLDVYDVEPLPLDHPYRSHPKIVATPHIGYVTSNCYDVFIGESVDAISAWLAGTPVRVISTN